MPSPARMFVLAEWERGQRAYALTLVSEAELFSTKL